MIYLKEGRTPLNFAYSDEIVHDGNSTYQLSFKFPTNNPLWEELVEETLLLADDLHGEQEFIIFEVEKHHAYITVHANQVATLLNNYSITELSVNNASGDRVMRSLVGSIIREHKFTFSSDIASTHSINLKNVTVAIALFKDKHSILGQWGGDLIRDKYDIRLLSNGGTNKEALFMYKKNLKSYQQKKSIKDLRTRIHFTKTISSQKEGEKDKVIAVTVDSPLISKYKNIYEGNLDVSDQDVIDEVTLRKYGEQYFKTTLCDVIEESIEIDVVGNPDVPVNIFDTVTVFHEKFNLDVKKKITKYTFTPMGRKLKTIGFGKIQQGLGTTLASMIDDAVTEHVESQVDAFKIQKNLSELLKLDRKSIEDKLVDLEKKSNSALEVKRALFEADGNIPDVVKTKILDAVEAEVGRLKTIITEAELIKAIQAKLNYAEIKNALIDKAFINQIISDERFTQQFKDGEVTTQNIFTKLKDSIKSNISKDFVTKEGVKKLVNDLTINADGIRQITQQESEKVFEKKKVELKGVDSYIHKKYSDFADGRNMSDNSTLKYIGIYTGDKQQAPTNASEYSWTKIKVDGKLYKAYSNSLNGLDFTIVEPDENAKLFAKNRPRVNIVNDNDISDIWQANMFLSFKPNTKYTLTARAKGNSNKLWAYFRNNRTNAQYNWGQLEFRGLETKSITFTTTNDVDDVLFKFILVPEDEDWTGVQIDWFTIYEGDKRYTDYPVNEPAQYHKYRYFGYVFKEGTPVASDFEWFDLQQTSITNDKYTHIVYSDNADGSNFGREPKKYMGVARTTSPTQPTDKTAYKWFKVTGEDGRDGVDGKSINRNYIVDSEKLTNITSGGTNWEKTVENGTLVFTKVRVTESTGIWTQIMPFLKDNFQNEVLTWSLDVKASKNISFNNVGQETNGFKGRVDITTQWQRISHTFTNRYTQWYSFVFYQMIGTCSPGDKIYVRLPKLEKGNDATEWSPAYEDLRGRDGVSNYIHRKYSDYSNGANMDDNSSRKYIGIYTGTSPTPPTTASSYLWSKIKGEDGANGVPGAKGADGRTPYFHTAYANSPTGDRDFSTTNSNDKLYIGTYSDFEVADSNDYRKYKWVKIKGEDGRNGNNGRDGVSSYIYRKYSDNANGSPMSDNSSLKYIGIYTGTSATAPTTPSAYTWSKIKGEDGQQGVPGARGTDGRTSYLHTAYSNSPTGDRDFSTTNSANKEYIGTYSDFEINDSNDYRRYKWVKIKGENGRDGKSINENLLPNSIFNQGFAKWEDKLTNSGLNHSFDHAIANFGRGLHIWGTANADYKGLSSFPFNLVAKQGDKLTLSMDLGKDALNNNAPLLLGIHYMDDKGVIVSQQWQTLDLATQNFEVRKYKRISRVFTVQKDIRKCRVMIYATTSQLINFYIDNIKLERGEVATEWSPAYEDLQAHTLTANLRLEGTYINGVTNNVKCYLDVFYDGQKITDGFNAQIKFKGGILNTWSNFWTAKVDNTGFLTNVSWGDKEQQYPIALDVIVLVTYKDLNAVANARMENIPDVVEIKEVVKKYKTFESTLEGFTSVVGEINTKVLTKQQIRQNLSSEDVEKTGNDLYFNTKENLVANEYYTILADLDNVPANQQAYIYSASDGGDKKTIQNGLNYWVVKYTTNQNRINLYPLGTNTKVKNVRIYKGDFRVKKDDERENLYSSSATDSGDKFIHLNLIKNKINGNVYTVKFDASGFSNGDRWDIYNRIGYNQENLTQVFKTKDNEFTFTINDNTTDDRIYIRMIQVGNTKISNVEIYDVTLGYAKNKEVSKLESSIKQTKDEIDLKVSKDNVIAAINASVETTGEGPAQGVVKINADKVDIRGALRAYKGYIGGFQIGTHPEDMSKYWLTGSNQFYVGMSNGGGDWGQTALWVNWGTKWSQVGDDAWFVKENGKMYCYNQAEFWKTPIIHGNLKVTGDIIYDNGKWCYSKIYNEIGKNGNRLFLRGNNGAYDYINIDSLVSDRRLKSNIKKSTVNALEVLNKFETYSFTRKYREDVKDIELGIMAQDVKKYMHDAFVEHPDGYYTYEPFEMQPYLIKAIQELSTENQQLKSQLKEMNERLTKLEDKINGNL